MEALPEGDEQVLHVICRANRGRSPLVGRVLERALADSGVSRPPLRVRASGLSAERGHPVLPVTAKVAGELGLDLTGCLSQSTDLGAPSQVWGVVTFERSLMRSIVDRHPELAHRTFLLKEIVRISRSPSWSSRWNGSPDVWERLDDARPYVDAGDDETADPAEIRRKTHSRRVLVEASTDARLAGEVLFGPPA